MAQGALDFYRAFQAERVSRGDGARVADDPTKQVVAAEAAAVIDEIKVVLRRNFDEMMDLCRKGEKIPVDRRVQFRYESARTVGKCVEIVDGLFAACGGASIFLENRINLFFQDVHAANAHYANNPDKPGRNFGGVQFGMKNTDYFI
jgi:3-hydroxy-9,10-secoandrosta-1,3,5(10)-triene-9,17-dione monooxygenase